MNGMTPKMDSRMMAQCATEAVRPSLSDTLNRLEKTLHGTLEHLTRAIERTVSAYPQPGDCATGAGEDAMAPRPAGLTNDAERVLMLAERARNYAASLANVLG